MNDKVPEGLQPLDEDIRKFLEKRKWFVLALSHFHWEILLVKDYLTNKPCQHIDKETLDRILSKIDVVRDRVMRDENKHLSEILDFICYLVNPENVLSKYETNNNVIKDLIDELMT